MRLLRCSLCWIVAGLGIFGCVEPYAPPEITDAPHLLVIDGFFNATAGQVTVKLSRTISLTDNNEPPKETNAIVQLEDEDGGTMSLTEVLPGEYVLGGLTANAELKYRLRINTTTGEYLSNFVPVKVTPAIERVKYDTLKNEMEVSVTTSDPTGESDFYRWTFSETFQYIVPYQSTWILDNRSARQRESDEYIYRCWRTDKSHSILVATSSGFSEDRITDFLLTKVPRSSMKIMEYYSIEVQQQALTAEGFAYWEGLYNTTENVGGLFDPLPGQINGNFFNVSDPNEVVVGFFSAATVSKKRLFIDVRYDLPENYSTYRHPLCVLDSISTADVPSLNPRTLLYGAIYAQGMPVIIGYTTGEPMCLDCKVHGGVTTKPEFWP
jgi:hypothetical protein